jgi:hypothetical protein
LLELVEVEGAVAVGVERAHDALAVGQRHLVAGGEADGQLELEVVEAAVARAVEALEDLAQPRLAGDVALPKLARQCGAHLQAEARRGGGGGVQEDMPRAPRADEVEQRRVCGGGVRGAVPVGNTTGGVVGGVVTLREECGEAGGGEEVDSAELEPGERYG